MMFMSGTHEKAAIGCSTAAAVCIMITLLGMIAAFLLGMASAFGVSLNPITAFRLITDLFSFSKAKAWQCIFGALVGVMYFGNIIWMLKGVAAIAIAFKRMNSHDSESVYHGMVSITSDFGIAFVTTFLFVAITGFVGGGNYSVLAYIVLAVSALVLFLGITAREFVIFWSEMSKRVFYFLTALFVLASISFLFWLFTQQDLGNRAIRGIGMFFGGSIGFKAGFGNFVYSFYLNFIEPILFLVVFVLIVYMAYDFVNGGNFFSTSTSTLTSVLVLLGIAFVMEFVCRSLLTANLRNFSMDLIGVWFNNVKSLLLPALAPIVGLFWLKKI